MEKSFFIVPKESKRNSANLNDSPYPALLSNDNTSFSMTIKRKEMIQNICDGTEKSYKSEYPHIVKLCRLCIADICKELTERVNFATMRFKRYTKVHDQLVAGTYPYPSQSKDALIEDLEISTTDAKYHYNQYHTLYQDLKKKKLYTKACVICAEIKVPDAL